MGLVTEERRVIRPQPGPQEMFLASGADIVIYGGGAGSGKTFGLLVEPLRHAANPGISGFYGVIFRRYMADVKTPGGMWDESTGLYPGAYGLSRGYPNPEWNFPRKNRIRFGHLEHEETKLRWQGAQICYLAFDELTHFTESMFWYMLSRNRSTCGVTPYVRATTNADADSWVARLIDWWIGDDGYAIPERSGVVRFFVRIGDQIKWADTPEELAEHKDDTGEPIPPKSFTYISAVLDDNPILNEIDPSYRANLMALATVERERLLGANWKIRPQAGMYFKRGWVTVVREAPTEMKIVRGWDLAATEETPSNDPDWTCGTKIGMTPDKRIFILDHVWDRLSPAGVDRLLVNTASQDTTGCEIWIPQDPAQAGKAQVTHLSKLLAGYNVRFRPVTGDKITRFSPFSAQCEAGNVYVLEGKWNERWFTELENFPPEIGHDDDADSTATAFDALARPRARPASTVWAMR